MNEDKKYEYEIKARHEKSAELNALLETDNKINNLLGQAKEYPNKDICNEILTNLEVLKAQINGCKKHGVSIPQLHCNNPKEIAEIIINKISFLINLLITPLKTISSTIGAQKTARGKVNHNGRDSNVCWLIDVAFFEINIHIILQGR